MRCKPGDIAYVVETDYPDSLGMLVTVTDDWCLHPISFDHCWLVKGSQKVRCWDANIDVEVESDEFYARDASLRPITPPGLNTDVKDEEPVESGVTA